MRGTYQHLLCSQRSGKERERSTSAACFFFYVAPTPRQHLPFFPLSLSRALHTHIHQQLHRKATKKKSIVFGKSQQRQPTERRMQPRNSPSFRHKQHKQNETKTKKQKMKTDLQNTRTQASTPDSQKIHSLTTVTPTKSHNNNSDS